MTRRTGKPGLPLRPITRAMDGESTKVCVRCDRAKPLGQFNVQKGRHSSWCRCCTSTASTEMKRRRVAAGLCPACESPWVGPPTCCDGCRRVHSDRAKARREAAKAARAVPPHDEFWAAIDAAPANRYVGSYSIDWGGKRGQGRRRGGMVMGAMSDAPQGVRTYTTVLAKAPLSDANRREAAGLTSLQQVLLAKALAAGYSPTAAFLASYTVGPDPIDRAEVHGLVAALGAGAFAP